MKIEHIEWLLKLPADTIAIHPALWNRIQAIRPNPPKIEVQYGHDPETMRRKVVGYTIADRKVELAEAIPSTQAGLFLKGQMQAIVGFPESLDGLEIKTV